MESAEIEWVKVTDKLPPEGDEVEIKIDDGKGIRNETTLKLYRGIWWFPDMSMYVYFTPTHWRAKPASSGGITTNQQKGGGPKTVT